MPNLECNMSEEELIQGLINRENSAFRCLYIQCFANCKAFVLNNGGTLDDAKDFFQNAIAELLKENKLERFFENRSAKICTFLYKIVRNQWLNNIRNNHKFNWVEPDDKLQAIEQDEDFNELEELKLERWNVFKKCFALLKDTCQQVILLSYIERKKDEEIAEILSLSVAYVKLKRFRCMQELKECAKQ